jgi:hypothetical protein
MPQGIAVGMPLSQPCTTQECREAALAAFRAQHPNMQTTPAAEAEGTPRPVQVPAKAGGSPMSADAAMGKGAGGVSDLPPGTPLSPGAIIKGNPQEGAEGSGTPESGSRVRSAAHWGRWQ